MDKRIANMRDHVVVCGWGRVGRAVADDLARSGKVVVVVDSDGERLRQLEHPTVIGDATLDATLRAAGIEHASALVAALTGDAENLFVTLSGRSINPSLFIMQEFEVIDGSPLAGKSLRDADLRQRANVLVLALRHIAGTFTTNPDPDTVIEPKQVIIAVGTGDDLSRFEDVSA